MPTEETREYRFKIGAYSPTRMPLGLLSEYLKDIAILFGEEKSVHLIRIENGSTCPVILAEKESIPKINERLHLVKQKEGPDEAQRAWERIDNRLRSDNAKGNFIIAPDKSKILEFPGASRAKVIEYGPFTQFGNLDGTPIEVGGKNDPVSIHLQGRQGEIYFCKASRAIAKEIALHLFSSIIRVEGNGRWKRYASGNWEMINFTIKDFKLLKEVSLVDELTDWQKIDAEWKKLEDPLRDLDIIRHENEIQ